jgi:endonuclease-3
MIEQNKEYYYKITGILRAAIGDPEILHQSSPLSHTDSALEVLLATILTQATSDQNALRAWLEYKRVFKTPEQVLQSDKKKLFHSIRSAGLAAQKTKTIYAVLQQVKDKLGDYSLSTLKDDPTYAWDFLNQLPGVGPKTAACTMLFGFGFPQFPVDVHIQRIAKRMGWITGKAGLEKSQQMLLEQIPAVLHRDLHILLLNLGRRYCRPSKAICQSCPLDKYCPKQF